MAHGGFTVESNRTDIWTRHVEFIATTFGDLVDGWQPVNETNYYARAAYGGLGWPPGSSDRPTMAMVDEAVQLATAEAAVILRQTGKPVSSIFGLSPIIAQDDHPESLKRMRDLYEGLWAPGLGLFRDGILRVPGREPITRPDLAESFDLFGFSYYSSIGVREGQIVPHPPEAPVSPLGYGISADGLGDVLHQLAEEIPSTPLLVAEFGIGTNDDGVRESYLDQGLEIIRNSLARGIDIRGFFHWTAVDNYEWLHGYELAFGLLDGERNVKRSALALRTTILGDRD